MSVCSTPSDSKGQGKSSKQPNRSTESPKQTSVTISSKLKSMRFKKQHLSEDAMKEARTRCVTSTTESAKYNIWQMGSDTDGSDNERNDDASKSQASDRKPLVNSKGSPRGTKTKLERNSKNNRQTKGKACQYWAEVYIPPNWVAVDVVNIL